METRKYQMEISASAKLVWNTMLNKDTYEQWVAKSWPGSTYQGKWEKGELIRFTGSDGGGTMAELIEYKPYEEVLARHVAVLGPGGKEDRNSDVAKGWIGTMEGYHFEEKDGKTKVTVTIETYPDWLEMFDEGWPVALEDLKRITESQLATA